MLLTKNIFKKVSLASFAVFLLFSCSKDADLLSEYVIADKNNLESIALLVDDSFFISNGQQSILLDVLNNDTFESGTQVNIVSTSLPINGSVIINDNNTLTYTPQIATPIPVEKTPVETTPVETTPVETTPVEDTFTYTTEVTTNENEVLRQEATVTISTAEMGELFAFPGAEGFGKYTTGGRGGTVIHVTNLNDSGTGSLRSALLTKGARTIVFDVGGNINLDSQLYIGPVTVNNPYEDVTIAGETAPYPGITITGGFGLNVHASNVIIRYITIRSDVANNQWSSLNIRNWGTNGYIMENIMLDHITLSHGGDANLDLFSSSNATPLRKLTLQNSMLHNDKGSGSNLIGAYTNEISILRNYYSHNAFRNPLIGYGDGTNDTKEFINNIVFGGNNSLVISRGNIVDGIANIFKSFENNPPIYDVFALGSIGYDNPVGSGSIFIDGNFVSGSLGPGVANYGSELLTYNQSSRVVTNSYVTSWLTTQSEIEESVLPTVGNSLHRDALDISYVTAYAGNTGTYSIPSIPEKTSTKRESDYDTDMDGMADAWERTIYGDLSKSANGDENGDGYTNLETFLFTIIQ